MTSPALKSSVSRPAAQRSTSSSNSRQVVSCQMPLLFSRIATRPGKVSALRASTRISVVSVSKFQADVWSARGMRTPDIGLDDPRVGYHVGRNTAADHGAVIQRQHAIADAGDDVHMMLDQ